MSYKVIQWATGAVGAEGIRYVIEHPDLELVGVYVYSAAKDGVDAGELAGVEPIGVKATTDRDAILELDADCVIHAPAVFHDGRLVEEDNDADVEALLRSGKNVVSTAGYVWPPHRGAELQQRLEHACRTGGSTLLGTGINPGFFSERIAATATGMNQRIDSIKVSEHWDATDYPTLETISDLIGIGKPVEWLSLDQESMAVVGEWFYASLRSLVHALGGGEVERFERAFDYRVATRDIEFANGGKVVKDSLGAIEWTWTAIVDGRPFASVTDRWIADWDVPDWGGDDRRQFWRIDIEGLPKVGIRFDFEDNYPSIPGVKDRLTPAITAAAALNAVPDVCAASPGFLQPPAFAPCLIR